MTRLTALNTRVEHLEQRTERLLQRERERVHERASLAAMPRARLLAASIALEGTPSERLQVRRVRVGEPVARSFGRWVGLTRCASTSPDVRELWARLLTFEAECGDDVLRGLPCTILDVPGAAAVVADGTLRITPRFEPRPRGNVVAIPRCTYDAAARKVGNFGHWMLDWAPQVVALWKLAPDATFLMPHAAKWFHTATLARMGLDPRRMVPWDGSPVECARLLAFESDGRMGGGRPLSLLTEVRRLLEPAAAPPGTARARRIYVSRRDAPKKRRWIVNEPEVEALFRSRGFDVIVMRDCPFDEQVRLFREARVVAGLNGGGLTDIVFAPRGADVIVLLSDTLIRWYAGGGRSVWAGGARGTRGRLAALGDSPRFWTHVAATFDQRCHSFVGGDVMPLGELARFLDDVLAEADRT
ncbi:MAG: glycosyltransferase family 61 protein [Acidobacteria bacterium]|nr:glycosyltransferase family 61 protein [Acidobacteriota bacterium]